MNPTIVLAVLIGSFLSEVCCIKQYVNEFPNGDKVPNPCQPSRYIGAIGHENPHGAGKLNVFGLDFSKFRICKLDSDKDGKTNGEELGDPNCVWKKGAANPQNIEISHPGLCTPVESSKCKALNTCEVSFDES